MKTCVWIGLLGLLIGGCGELSYKRGASTQDLQAAKTACASAGSERAAEQCLAEQGWTVKRLDDVDLFATVGVNPDNRQPGAFVTPAFVPVAPAQPVASAQATPTATAFTAAPGAPATPAPATSAPMAVATPAAADPLDLYTISSWWKMGADNVALAADTETCVGQLGGAHKPRAATQQYTRGFVVCMHAQGWKALRAVAG